jgi:predicted TIM-barrel fold metal-dependent hydrolase
MIMSAHPTPEQVRAKIDHPIVDGDGHWVEYDPVFSERMRKVRGDLAADGFLKAMATTRMALQMTPAERRRRRVAQPAFWARQTENTLDRATAMMPRLLYDRLDELGLDFVVVYPTAGLRLPRIEDDAARRAVIRAYNIVSADYFKGLGDRLTPAAIIPMHSPDEAIAELEFVTRELGSKVGMFGSNMGRRVRASAANDPDTARLAAWYDVLGLDSEYDYDPVWAKCVELAIAPTFHSASSSQGLRLSPTNFVYNHIGHFAAAGHATAKAIFLGGVTRRFPELRFAFLEGGVGWASQLFGDLVEHWERRSAGALERMHPDRLDRAQLLSLVEKYGYDDIAAALRERGGLPDPEQAYLTGGIADVDDFAACKIAKKEDWVELYAKPFYFGCEADDRMNATAFGRHNPFGARLNAIFSSDIGHFDVIDMRDPLPEAYELVEDGHIAPADFRDFTFENAVRLWGTQNPRFFEGTRVAKEAAAVLAAADTPSRLAAE